MKKTKQVQSLIELLKHKDNDPLDVIKITYPDIFEKGKNTESDLAFYINIEYCCFESGKKEGTLKSRETKILKAIGKNEAILIKMKYDTLANFKKGFSREMHWINQTYTRRERFEEISKLIFDKVEKTVQEIKDLNSYIEKNFESITKKLPINSQEIKLQSLNKLQVLELLSKNEITPKKAEKLIEKLDADNYEKNADKLCPFSGSGRNPDAPRSVCSRTGDPKRIGDCGSCRVASDWEEAFG